jgi:hypothetical membrane protein
MQQRVYALFGVLGPLVVYVTIGVSIVLSPSFNWENDALSDLGHAVRSEVASIFNFGLLLAGFLLIVYAVTVFRKHAKYTSIGLLISAFMIQLLATFDEVYGSLHYVISVPHSAMLSITSIMYAAERKSSLALVAFLMALVSWALYGLKIWGVGIAVPEAISKIVLLWIMRSAIRIYLSKRPV